MMEAVDKADSADFTCDDVLDPKGWELLSFLMDARTGLGRFREFRVSNYDLMMMLIDCCRDMRIDDILALPDVAERVELFFEQHELLPEQIERVAEVHDNLVVLDLRDEETIYAGNRFVVYALFPQCDISMHVMWGREKPNTVYTVGKSIFDRRNRVDIGDLMLRHGGGGHHAAGTCQGPNETADQLKSELIDQIVASSQRIRVHRLSRAGPPASWPARILVRQRNGPVPSHVQPHQGGARPYRRGHVVSHARPRPHGARHRRLVGHRRRHRPGPRVAWPRRDVGGPSRGQAHRRWPTSCATSACVPRCSPPTSVIGRRGPNCRRGWRPSGSASRCS